MEESWTLALGPSPFGCVYEATSAKEILLAACSERGKLSPRVAPVVPSPHGPERYAFRVRVAWEQVKSEFWEGRRFSSEPGQIPFLFFRKKANPNPLPYFGL